MRVPQVRLIVLAAVVLLPASLLAARSGTWTPAAWTAAAVLLGVALLDAVVAGRRLAGLSVAAPEICRLTVGRPARIALTLTKPREARLRLRIGLALPAAVHSEAIECDRLLAGGEETHQVLWPVTALRRGRHPLAACRVEVPSPAGLWGVRRRIPLACEIRTYPNLAAGQKHLLGLFSRREPGWRSSRQIGKGREFEELRDYLPGDSYEDIDWKATARRRHPVTRVYQVEQSQEIYVVLDGSLLSTRSSGSGSGPGREAAGAPATIFERYLTAALVMALAAEREADRYGLLIFGARPDFLLKAGRGRAHYNACREALYNRMPRREAPDFDELFTFIGTHLRKRALLVFLTNLDDPLLAEQFVKAVPACARRHVLLVNMLRPAGAYPLFSSPDIEAETEIYAHLAGHMLWSALSQTRRHLKTYGAGFALLDGEAHVSQLVSQYLEVKQRQIL